MMTPYEFFKQISLIPRGSGNESAIADYIEGVARENGLFCIRDSLNNVFVRKSASSGMEDKKSILFAAHTDMVCEKLPSSSHDFKKDPIALIEQDGFVRANGTTLGADDGAGVATMLSLMTDASIIAPETEYLFTSAEETGMDGAFAFDYSVTNSELIVNLDNSAECSACIGCASGKTYETKLPIDRTPKCSKAVKIEISGLAGGHSGAEIDSGKQSAIKLLAHLLDAVYSVYPFHLVSVSGGGKDNVISPNASATVIFYGDGDEKTARTVATEQEKLIKTILCPADLKKFRVTFTKLKEAEQSTLPDMMTLKSTSTVLSALLLSPQGPLSYIPDTDQVRSSVNLGILYTENESVIMRHLSRSSSAYAASHTEQMIYRLSKAHGGTTESLSGYPGWEYKRGTALQGAYESACLEVYKKAPVFSACHAGLECGIFYDRLSALGRSPDIISVGPNAYDIHSVKERMEIASLDTLYKTLTHILKNV